MSALIVTHIYIQREKQGNYYNEKEKADIRKKYIEVKCKSGLGHRVMDIVEIGR